MKLEEMDGLGRSRQFKRLRKLFFEALGKAWDEESAEYQTVFEPQAPDELERSKAFGGYGHPMQIIPNGEWSLICDIRGGKKDGR